MKVFRTTLAAVAVAALTILAQTLLTTGATSAETVPPPAAPANIGIINSREFSNEKTGITRVNNAMNQLEAKFQPVRTEIRGMAERLNTMRSDIQKKRAIQDAATTARQVDEAERLEVQVKRKQEDARASYDRELETMLGPLQQDIANAIGAYAQAKGITMVIDANRVPMIYAAPSHDITRDFISDYNQKNPAGAVPAPARPAPTQPATARPSPARPTRP
ncbi:MAG TPA: OmpH family outer membrane protein [Pyrinomonadaceae bacterium]|nr:OmpH family outer membrane protein [Pyrinomonadaceae bacterium]